MKTVTLSGDVADCLGAIAMRRLAVELDAQVIVDGPTQHHNACRVFRPVAGLPYSWALCMWLHRRTVAAEVAP